VECHVIDVSDAVALELLFGLIVRQRGGVDLLVNGAAVYPREALGEMTPESWAAGVATNLNGVAYGCMAAIRTLPANRAAVILNVGSFAYLGPEPASTLYCATKAAISSFTRALAIELVFNGSPLIVNEWVPGVYRTRMSGNTGEDPVLAFERILTVWELSKQRPGGRTFERGAEVVPRRSLSSRLKSLLTGRRA
jgi:meso-butanediol dehydrogenase/(S,S)-butanediol dehydrogenase/diacetyl reductase